VIRLPERAVTRFFVPLIDVLILLFCIFLLLPFVSAQADQPTPDVLRVEAQKAQADLKQAQADLAIEKRRTDELMKERADSAQRTVVWVVDIDGATGKLTYTPPGAQPGRVAELKSAQDAREFILNSKKKTEERAVKYLFLLPREGGAYPDEPMYRRLEEWFKGEAVAFVRR
jgi:hypothetical protein